MELVGEWLNQENLLVLAQDGSFAASLSGERFAGRWRVEGGHLWLGEASFRLQLIGSTLWLDNRPFQPVQAASRRRARAKVSKVPPKVPPVSPEAPRVAPEVPRVPPKLVGTWGTFSSGPVVGGGFHKSRVLTLNADGTYRMESDSYNSGKFGQVSLAHQEQGRWWLEGSCLWFEGSQGRASRRLDLRNHPKTGDPMIVLDGEAYVTRLRRPSW